MAVEKRKATKMNATQAQKKYFQECIKQAPERLKRVRAFQEEMEDQVRVSSDLLGLEISF